MSLTRTHIRAHNPTHPHTERVLVGTKDNQLIVWDVRRDTHTCLPSYLPEAEGNFVFGDFVLPLSSAVTEP